MLRIGKKGKALSLVPLLTLGALSIFTPTRAGAHYILNAPACWMSQDSAGGPQKSGPCAAPNPSLELPGTPTGAVTAISPGQTVSVSVTATVAHPGWYRVSLVQGPSSTQTLTTLPDPPQTVSTCTPTLMTNPVWSPTQPVIADGLGLPPNLDPTTQQTGTKTFPITIPANASCTAARPCTLQVIMVMTDHPATSCYYHHCADIATGAATDAGRADSSSTPPPDGGGSSTGAGGSSGSGATGTGGSGQGTAGASTGSTTGSTTGASTTAGATTGSTGAGGGTATPTAGGAGATSTEAGPMSVNAGCSCTLSSRRGTPAGIAAAVLALAAMRRRRRRR